MNSSTLSENRPRYRPSGKLHPARLVGALAMLAGTSAAMSVAFLIVLLAGLHFPVIILALPVIGLIAGVSWAVKYAQLRHPLLAALLAATCAASGYLGTFHLDQCLCWKTPWTALDRLPGYIAFRMETDGWFFQREFWVILPQPANPLIQPQVGLAQIRPLSLHWAALLADLGILIGAPAVAAWLAAAAPFSERRRQWMQSETLMLHPDTQAAFQQALAMQRLEQWVDAQPPRVPQQLPHWRLTVWYTPSEAGQEADPDVYVQIDRSTTLASGGREPPDNSSLWTIPSGGLRPPLAVYCSTYVRLLPAEAAALVTLLPGILAMAGPAREELAAEADQHGAPSARIWPVPASQAGRLLTAGDWWRVQTWATIWFFVIPAAMLTLTITLCAISAWLIDAGVLPTWSILFPAGIGIAAFLLYLRYALGFSQHPMGSYQHRFEARLLRAAIMHREGPLVSAAEEDAIYALARPRRLWKEESGNRVGQANYGLLVIDDDGEAILFEGNHERYCIPADAILDCTLETPPTQLVVVTDPWAVVITARLGSGTWEFPFFPLANIEGANNWERAAALLARIEELCGRDFGALVAPAPPPQTPVAVH